MTLPHVLILFALLCGAHACGNGTTVKSTINIAQNSLHVYQFNNRSIYFDIHSPIYSAYWIEVLDNADNIIYSYTTLVTQCFIMTLPTTGFIKPYHLDIACNNGTATCVVIVSRTDCMPACTSANLCGADGCGGFCSCFSESNSPSPSQSQKHKNANTKLKATKAKHDEIVAVTLSLVAIVVVLVGLFNYKRLTHWVQRMRGNKPETKSDELDNMT